MKQELLKGLSEEQIAKLRACKDQKEMLALAKQEGVELTDEQLEAVSGGVCSSFTVTCPECGEWWDVYHAGDKIYSCRECGCRFHENGTVYSHGDKYKC